MDLSRKAWLPGPWDKEPDTDRWVDADTGYNCHARRSGMGSWCGYVELPANHPDVGSDYDDIDVQVHGGLTYAGGRVFGFDCAHWNDISPAMMSLLPERYLARQFFERRHG